MVALAARTPGPASAMAEAIPFFVSRYMNITKPPEKTHASV